MSIREHLVTPQRKQGLGGFFRREDVCVWLPVILAQAAVFVFSWNLGVKVIALALSGGCDPSDHDNIFCFWEPCIG